MMRRELPARLYDGDLEDGTPAKRSPENHLMLFQIF